MNRKNTFLPTNPFLFKQVLNATGVAMAVRDTDLTPVFINKAFADFYGYTEEELYSLPAQVALPKETLTLYLEEVRLFLQSGKAWEGEYSIRTKNGATVSVWGCFKPVHDSDGNLSNVISTMQDSLEYNQKSKTLQDREDSFRFLAENSTDVIWTMDDQYNFIYATPSAVDVWGYTLEELKQTSLQHITLPNSHATLQKAAETRAQAEVQGRYDHINRLEMEHLHGKGHPIWVETVIRRLYTEEGEPKGYQGISRDITLRKRTEAALKEREARYRTLFEDSPISLWEEDLSQLKVFFDQLKKQGVTDFRQYFNENPDKLTRCASLVKVVDVNKATLDLLGASSKDELFGNLEKVLTDSSMVAFTEEMILLASGGCEYCGEITNRTLKGETIWVMVHFCVPPEYMGSLSRVIVSLLDVTPRKNTEQALKDSEERYRVLAENSQEGVLVLQDRKVRYLNESMGEIFGLSMDEFEQIHPLELTHPEDRPMIHNQFRDLFNGKPMEGFATFRIITPQRDIKWLGITAKPIMWGGRNAQLQILTDITHHKVMEQELLSAHAQMEDRIRKRTMELSEANVQLKAEAEERSRAQNRIFSLTQELIRIQEDERQRIARDLHDNVAQDLSSIMLRMETLFDDQDCVDAELTERGEAIGAILRKAIASVRDIAYGLRPPALDQVGLVSALQNLCLESGNKNDFSVDFVSTGIEDLTLDFDTEINIYRIVQEAFRNIARHAKANRATIRLVKSHPDILIRIEDNGQGFEVQKRTTKALAEKRMGLRSMEERARLIGGSMEIKSLVGTGTRIVFRLPTQHPRRHT